MRKDGPRFAAALVAAQILCAMATPSGAWAAVSEDQARRSVEQQFGVRVLKAERTTFHDRPVYLLTVMSPGGDSNLAFQVNWLAVDVETGRLVSGFRHRPSGTDEPGGARSYETEGQPNDVFKQGRVRR